MRPRLAGYSRNSNYNTAFTPTMRLDATTTRAMQPARLLDCGVVITSSNFLAGMLNVLNRQPDQLC